jgi:hypothetical protein
MNKQDLNNAFEALTPDENTSERLRVSIRQKPERQARPIKRFAAIAVAACMLFGFGIIMQQQLGVVPPSTDEQPLPPVAYDPSETPGGPSPHPDSIHTELVPYTIAPEPIQYNTFWGTIPEGLGLPLTPQVFENDADLQAFIIEYGIGVEENNYTKAFNVDFTQKAVIAVYNYEEPPLHFVLNAPIVSWGSTIHITRRTVRAKIQYSEPPEPGIEGYFLTVDREIIDALGTHEAAASSDRAQYIYYNTGNDPNEPQEMENLTPDALRNDDTPGELLTNDIRVYKDSTSFETYLMQPKVAARPLGGGFGGFGVNCIDAPGDASYLVYTYSWGSGIHRSHAAVDFLDGSGRTWTSGWFLHRDMTLEPLGGNKWGVYQAEVVYGDDPAFVSDKLLAYLTVRDDGVLIEVMHEDGLILIRM